MRWVVLLLLVWGVGAEAVTVGIYTCRQEGVAPWDPDSVKRGIAGSEEAVIYMAKELVALGYEVTVFGDPPEGSIYRDRSANPCFIPVEEAARSRVDIAISWRMPQVGPALRGHAKRVYFWPHDLCGALLTDAEIDGFDDVLWLSKWQREQWIAVNPRFAKFPHIFGNGINVEQFHPVQTRENPYSCIYSSNYARGLEILLDIWPFVKRTFPRATLDIYYGWKHWGLLSPAKEIKMRAQLAQLAPLDVRDHGMVSHEELTRAHETISLWTYPCTAPETFCITAIRAQLAGNLPVIVEGSALGETVRGGYRCASSEEYLLTLLLALSQVESITQQERAHFGRFVKEEYTWHSIASKWHSLFTSL